MKTITSFILSLICFYTFGQVPHICVEESPTDGIVTNDNAWHGLTALNNQRGAYASGSVWEGFGAWYNLESGFYAQGNAFHGYMSVFNNYHGYHAYMNTVDGYRATENGNDGFEAAMNGGAGIWCWGNAGWAGDFSGNVQVSGNISKGGGTFKIDHPLDPENKLLYHSFVESPDMMNIYNGNVETDQNGIAIVELPAYFNALNMDYRYQLTTIGTMSQAIVQQEIMNNAFRIRTDQPNVKVSWQVTGVRNDPYAQKNRVIVEVEKEEKFKGQYIHPDAYDVEFEKGYDYIKLGKKTPSQIKAEKVGVTKGTPMQKK